MSVCVQLDANKYDADALLMYLATAPQPICAEHPPMPLEELGFITTVYDVKNSMANIPRRSALCINPYETFIPGVNRNIRNRINVALHAVGLPPMVNRAFAKIMECDEQYQMIPPCQDMDVFHSLHLCEAPGSFLQYTVFHQLRKSAASRLSPKMHFFGVSLHPETQAVCSYDAKFMAWCEASTHVHALETTSDAAHNGDVTKPCTHQQVMEWIGHTVGTTSRVMHFVTGDGGFEWKDENMQEQEACLLIVAQTVLALQTLADGGTLFLKVFDLYTRPSIQLVWILTTVFEDVRIVKPCTSRLSNSEKYIVAKGYRYNAMVVNWMKDAFGHIVEQSPTAFIHDLFQPSTHMDEDFLTVLHRFNVTCRDVQIDAIQRMQAFDPRDHVEANACRQRQIQCNDKWIRAMKL